MALVLYEYSIAPAEKGKEEGKKEEGKKEEPKWVLKSATIQPIAGKQVEIVPQGTTQSHATVKVAGGASFTVAYGSDWLAIGDEEAPFTSIEQIVKGLESIAQKGEAKKEGKAKKGTEVQE